MTKLDEIEKTANTAMGVAESAVNLLEEMKPAVDKIKKSIDKNKDGKISIDEVVTWGGELLNGEGFKMLLFTLGSIVFMIVSDLVIDYFDLIAQNSIWGIIGKIVAVALLTYGWKTVTANMDKEKKKLVAIIQKKDETIRQKDEVIHADHLAIEMLKFQVNDSKDVV